MGIMDIMNINYKEIFNGVMKAPEAQSMMADFLNHCLLHCDETRQCIMDVLSKDDNFNSIVEKSIEKVIKKNKMKSEFFD